ncbi:MAG: YbaK/prolyl-tRNA synthetase associated domain-containing protein [Stygiobacter sp.]|nr:MAG: YbaK/prolyl-tRNA synthetase associated domain-containing protein [Stygiobacter sp.]
MQDMLYRRLEQLGIQITAPVPYPIHRSVEEGKQLRGDMAGTFTKNLLLKDKKGRLFLVAAHEDRPIDLKTLHQRIGASGRVGFAAADQMTGLLGVQPGALTPFAIMNDHDGLVAVVLDADLSCVEQLNFHPMLQTFSVGISGKDLIRYIESYGRQPLIVDLAGAVPPSEMEE